MSKVLISSSSRYSIYKVQTLSRSPQRPVYLSTSCRICQALFTSFFKFFCAVRCAPGFRLSSRNLFILSQTFSFVKYFFRSFQTFFCFLPPLLRRLAYISTVTRICQALFYKFLTLFLCILSSIFTIKKPRRNLRGFLHFILYCIP